MSVSRQYLATKDAAEFLGMSEQALSQLRYRDAGPPFVRINQRIIRYSYADLIRWLESRTVRPGTNSAEGGAADVSP